MVWDSDYSITKCSQLDSEDAYSIILYGSGALVALWLTSALVGAIDSIPLVRIKCQFWVSLDYKWYIYIPFDWGILL